MDTEYDASIPNQKTKREDELQVQSSTETCLHSGMMYDVMPGLRSNAGFLVGEYPKNILHQITPEHGDLLHF